MQAIGHHLLAANLMSAPAAVGMAKMVYPETQKSSLTYYDIRAYAR